MDGLIFIQEIERQFSSPVIYNILIGLSIALIAIAFMAKSDLIVCSCAIFGIISFAIGMPLAIIPDSTLYYQVMLEDNININEFSQKYEIIEQQGISYIIKEK